MRRDTFLDDRKNRQRDHRRGGRDGECSDSDTSGTSDSSDYTARRRGTKTKAPRTQHQRYRFAGGRYASDSESESSDESSDGSRGDRRVVVRRRDPNAGGRGGRRGGRAGEARPLRRAGDDRVNDDDDDGDHGDNDVIPVARVVSGYGEERRGTEGHEGASAVAASDLDMYRAYLEGIVADGDLTAYELEKMAEAREKYGVSREESVDILTLLGFRPVRVFKTWKRVGEEGGRGGGGRGDRSVSVVSECQD